MPGGGYAPRIPDTSLQDRLGLHFDYAANWLDSRFPRRTDYRPTAALQAALDEPITNAFQTHIGLSNAKLAPGDEFIPLLAAAPTNGVTPCAGALIRYRDMKGKVVISTVYEPAMDGADELTQAKMVPRANLISLHSGVLKLYWFQASDANYRNGDGFAIIHGGADGKPALRAYHTLTKCRPDGTHVPRGVHAVRTICCDRKCLLVTNSGILTFHSVTVMLACVTMDFGQFGYKHPNETTTNHRTESPQVTE